jgi:predicted membrane protein
MQTGNNIKTNTVIGIIVILIGGLFLARNFGVFPGFYLGMIFRWESILILVGLILYITSNNKSVGIILIIIGGLGLIPTVWPIIFIALGGYIIFKNKRNNSQNLEEETFSKKSNQNEKVNDTSIFGGGKKKFQIDNFGGGNIISIFGGSEINFMDSTLADGINKLEVFFLFGGSSFAVPSNWNVSIQTVNIFGGFQDKRAIHQSQVFDSNKHLVITEYRF